MRKINYFMIINGRNKKKTSTHTQDKNEMKCLGKCNTRNYTGLNNSKFTFYQRREGCKFYEQFNSYIDSDVIVFNSLKYKLESVLNRKPQTEVEIIDECDEFLDSFSNKRTIVEPPY